MNDKVIPILLLAGMVLFAWMPTIPSAIVVTALAAVYGLMYYRHYYSNNQLADKYEQAISQCQSLNDQFETKRDSLYDNIDKEIEKINNTMAAAGIQVAQRKINRR